MNAIEFGDYIRCRVGKRPQVTSCMDMPFPHAESCDVASDVARHP